MSALTNPSSVPIHSRKMGTSCCTTTATCTVGGGGAVAGGFLRAEINSIDAQTIRTRTFIEAPPATGGSHIVAGAASTFHEACRPSVTCHAGPQRRAAGVASWADNADRSVLCNTCKTALVLAAG